MAAADDAIDAIDQVLGVWKKASERGIPEKLAELFKKTGRITLLGSTGSGKSNFLKSLHASSGLIDPVSITARTQTNVQHKVSIAKSPFVVVDTPGQALHQAQRLDAIKKALADTPTRVVNVVSYGYHEYPTAQNALDADGNARKEYLEFHRDQEIAACTEWLQLLGDSTTTKWVLTVVAKADLWWDDYYAVKRHYEEGVYAQQLARDPNLQHAVLPYCAVIHRFFSHGHVSANFDDAIRAEINSDLLNQLVTLG